MNHEAELFVLTAFVLRGQKIIIKIALLIIEHLKDKIMKATAFDQIYSIISQDPFSAITPKVLCKLIIKEKKLKVTNRQLMAARERIRPTIVHSLQENIKSHQEIDMKFQQNRKPKFLN